MGLTNKQQLFCQNIVSGLSGKDSYIKAYNSKGSEQNAYNEASKLLLREDIQEYIKVLRKPLEKAVQTQALSEYEKLKQLAWERIEECTQNGDDTAVARYMDILNKMLGNYININKNIEEQATPVNNLDTGTLLKLVQ